ncbi:hypothetical protein BM536_008635 [Streptomyces phaeoluteigriseus]|uniref:Carbohydrate kinase PfkB domain-containing protein n=1 Tax=Streptomyces phaeoluteigriseus TaxID=114686 RepID=A0A1V6MV45_9ACTN|nr:PfkB family carbohydrate kinase [Streptomyces phaeoluteigriseus]OQD56328.1 hypothetical protein BM536_008635 [Streptomyces phaeoluteigriseus]
MSHALIDGVKRSVGGGFLYARGHPRSDHEPLHVHQAALSRAVFRRQDVRAQTAGGRALVLITFGSRGAWAVGRDANVHVPAPVVEVVDTVGAGDAFTAGALAHPHHADRLNREGVDALGAGDLARLLSYAVEIAADTCTRAGAQPPYRDDGVPPPG